jgi:transcriptional regulator with XRE-family HTH domain
VTTEPFYNKVRGALARQPTLPELYRLGRLIRTVRKRRGIPIPKLAEEVGLTPVEWLALEWGRLRVSYTTLTSILALLGISLAEIFGTKNDDFFPFVRLCMGKDPSDLTGGDADELYDLYLDLLAFRRMRSRTSSAQAAHRKESEG